MGLGGWGAGILVKTKAAWAVRASSVGPRSGRVSLRGCSLRVFDQVQGTLSEPAFSHPYVGGNTHNENNTLAHHLFR